MSLAKRYRVAYFSLETSPMKLFMCGVSNRTGIELRQLKRHELKKAEDRGLVVDTMKPYMREHPCHIVRAAGWTVEQVRACALQLRAQVIFVDYLGLLHQGGKSLYERVTEISKSLHTLAQTTGITVFALSQLNREGKGELPGMENLRESGQIEQDADAVLLMVQPEEPGPDGKKVPSTDKRYLKIAKNKDGESNLLIPMRFDGPTQRFYEVDETRGGEESGPW